MRHARPKIAGLLMEALERRELFSMVVKLPTLASLGEAPTDIPTIPVQPIQELIPVTIVRPSFINANSIDLDSFTVAANVPFTRKLATVPDTGIHYAIPSEVTSPAKMWQGAIQWGDATLSPAEFRRNDSGLVEIWGTHTYTTTGNFIFSIDARVVNFVPPGFDPNQYGWTMEVNPHFTFAGTAHVGEVATLDKPAASSPTDLTILPVKTKVVVEESAGGVLAVLTHQGFKLPGESSSGTFVRA